MENRINIGELDTLVTLFAPSASIGTQGEKILSYGVFSDVFAKVDLQADEVIDYSNLESENDITLTIYKVPQLTTRWRVKVSGLMYEITAIDHISRVSPLFRLTLKLLDHGE